MHAVQWRAPHRVAVRNHPDPEVLDPTDAVVEIEATGICGSDLHLFDHGATMGMLPGDVLGHEGVGRIVAKGAAVHHPLGTRVAVPFNIACGQCFMCRRGLQSQCEVTQNRDKGKGGALFGYTHLYGGVDGAQATLLRVPFAHYGLIDVQDLDAVTSVLLTDVLPTAWQAVEYSEVQPSETLVVLGQGPVGRMAGRIALHQGAGRVLTWDPNDHRRALSAADGMELIPASTSEEVAAAVAELTNGRGADRVIEAVGMDAQGSALDRALSLTKIQPDRLEALKTAMACVRRGGTLSVVGVYMGWFAAFPLGDLFDRQVTIRWGQANVRRYSAMLVDLLHHGDPLRARDFVTKVAPLHEAAEWYRRFRAKDPEAFKVVLTP